MCNLAKNQFKFDSCTKGEQVSNFLEIYQTLTYNMAEYKDTTIVLFNNGTIVKRVKCHALGSSPITAGAQFNCSECG